MARREKVFNEHRQKLTCGGERLCGEFVFFRGCSCKLRKNFAPRADRRMVRGRTYTGGGIGLCDFFEKGVLVGCGARLECLGKGVAGVWFKGWNAFFQNLMHERF